MTAFYSFTDRIIEISLGCGITVIIMLLISGFVKKRYNIQWRYFIWLALAVRMLIPFNITIPEKSVPVYIPPRAYINTQNAVHTQPVQSAVSNAAQLVPSAQREQAEKFMFHNAEKAVSRLPSVPLIFAVWLLGFICFSVYQAVSCISFNTYIKRWSEKPDKDIEDIFDALCADMDIKNACLYVCRSLETPVMTGFFNSKIYLPSLDVSKEQLRLILKHELVHKKRMDLWYKLLLLAANAVHWFNPLAYVMRRCADNDIELICDSIVLSDADDTVRGEYANAMLCIMKQSLKRKPSLSTHFLGGGRIMKERFSRLFDTGTKKRGLLLLCIVAAAALTCAGLFGCRKGSETELSQHKENSLSEAQIEYVGDASAVGRVRMQIDSMELAGGLIADGGMELQTQTEPYGAVFKYTTSAPDAEVKYKQLEAISAMYLALIKNLGSVTIELKNDVIDTAVTYTPDNILFYENVKSADTPEKLDALAAAADAYAKEADGARNISDSDIETVIQRALDDNLSFKRALRSSWGTEFGSAAHVTLRVDEDENIAYAYIITMESEYHFEHINSERIFTVCSGTGLIPAKMTLLKSDGKYKYDKIKYPMDGSMWIKSLEAMDYPDDLLKLITGKKSEKYHSYLSDYNDSRAEAYLKANNINAQVLHSPDHPPADMKNVEASNKLLDMYGEYPYFVGGEERVENGVRYLYTRDFDSSTQIATYTKTEFDTGKVIEKAIIDASSGDIKYLSGTPRKEHYSKYPE